jgi:hypothetical protein
MAIQERDFEQLAALVDIKLTGVSRAALKIELTDIIKEFLGDTNAWYEWMQLPIVTGVQKYAITPQHGGMIIRLVSLYDANKVIIPAHMADITPPGADIWLVWPQNITQTGTLLVIKNVILPNSRDEIPDAPAWLVPMYGRYLEDGLLGKLMAHPGKSYTNGMQSKYHLARFRDAITIVRTAVARSNILGGQSWRYPSQFRVNSQRGGVSTPFPSPSGWGV